MDEGGPDYRVLLQPIGSDVVELVDFGGSDSSRMAAWIRVDGWPVLQVAMPAARCSLEWDDAEEELFWDVVLRLARTHRLDGKRGTVDLVRNPPQTSAVRQWEPEGEEVER